MTDGPSIVMTWLLGATGAASAVVASQACFSIDTAATFCLVLSALFAVQLLGFVATCFSNRFWVVNHVYAPNLGPVQVPPQVRKGLPALYSGRHVAGGLDAWSLVVVSLLLVPVTVLPLMFTKPDHKPQHRSGSRQVLGIAAVTKQDHQRTWANRYTVGSFDVITLSLQSTISKGSSPTIKLLNTANVAIDTKRRRVYAPPHVDGACEYPEVFAQNITALVANYACASDTNANAPDHVCSPEEQTVGKGEGCVRIASSGTNSTTLYFVMDVIYTRVARGMKVHCDVSFGLATVSTRWQGDDRGFPDRRGRNCRITNLTELSYREMAQADWDAYNKGKPFDLFSAPNLQHLRLPYWNAFYHTIGPDPVSQAQLQDQHNFYGAIFAAGALLRQTGLQTFDPTNNSTTNDGPPTYAQVRYVTHFCPQYGWLAWFLFAANIFLVACGTVLGSGFC